jgi:hypothetical protein
LARALAKGLDQHANGGATGLPAELLLQLLERGCPTLNNEVLQ